MTVIRYNRTEIQPAHPDYSKSTSPNISGVPVLDNGEFEDADGTRRLYRAALLPLEDDAGEITLVIGGARCKAG